MAIHDLFTILGTEVLAAGSSDDDSGLLGYVLFASGFVFYAYVFIRYRNTDKRHSHESETEASLANMKEKDEFVKARRGLTNRRLRGANNTAVHGALNKSTAGLLGNSTAGLLSKLRG